MSLFRIALALLPMVSFAADQPQWGQAWTRNLVSDEKHLPDCFDPNTRQNVKWVMDLGTQGHSTPVVAGGRIFIGTNNANPRDPKHVGDRGVFMCLDEKDGHLLWAACGAEAGGRQILRLAGRGDVIRSHRGG